MDKIVYITINIIIVTQVQKQMIEDKTNVG